MEASEVLLRGGLAVRIRCAQKEDAGAIVALDRWLAEQRDGMVLTPDQVRSEAEERDRIERTSAELAQGAASVIAVAETVRERRLLGCAQLFQLNPALCRHVGIFALGVSPDGRRLGVGRALMMKLIDHAQNKGLERLELYVREDNFVARALYVSLGFDYEGTRKAFVHVGEGRYVDDFIMVKFLGRLSR